MATDDFRSLFEFLPIGAYRSTLGGRMLRSNAALVRLNGCGSEAELLALVRDIATEWYVDPGRREEFKALIERDGRVTGFVSQIRRQKTRELIWIRENAHVLRRPDGSIECYEGTVEEITAEVEAQQALQASREELQRIVDLLPGVTYLSRWNAQETAVRFTFVSRQMGTILGIDPNDALSEPDVVARWMHPDDRERAWREIRASLAANLPADIEFRVLSPRRGLLWVRMFSQPAQRDQTGRVRVGMLFDITEQRRTEQALHEQDEVWKRAMESSGDAVWDWNLSTGIESFTGQVARLYGYDPGELPPSPETMDALTHPDDVAAMRQAREDHFAQRTPAYVNEHRIRCRDGRWKWVLSRGVVIRRAADGTPLRMIGTHTDIDAARRAAELAHERDMAAAADRAKSEFLSRVSHELRTPLNAVLGFAQLLQRDGAELSAHHRQWVSHILSGGQHLLALVNDVLDLSAATGGPLRLASEAVDLAGVAAEVLAMLERDARAAEISLAFEPAGSRPDGAASTAQADRVRCRQIVTNLVANAIKYNRPGGRVGLRLAHADGQVGLSVVDDGPGIREEGRDRLFQPFERLHAEGTAIAGTGLGLALSRQLARAMGGSLELVQSSAAGSHFRLLLPEAGGTTAGTPVSGH